MVKKVMKKVKAVKRSAKKKAAKAVRPAFVSLLLDESSSMSDGLMATIDGFNEYVDHLKKGKTGPMTFNFLKFNSNGITTVEKGTPIERVKALSRDNYRPSAITPLIDACMKTIKATEDAVAKHKSKPSVMVIFQTDGQENASREFALKQLTDKIAEKKAQDWTFVFLGADVDAYGMAASMGIAAHNTVSYDKRALQTQSLFSSLARNTVSFAASGDAGATAFTGAQKRAAGDKFDFKINGNLSDVKL